MPVPDGIQLRHVAGSGADGAYHEDRCLYRFRFIRDYSGGQTTNFGAHTNDLAQWALGRDGSGPIEFEDLGAEFPEPGSLFNTPTKIDFRALYANGVELVCRMTQRGFGIRIEGTEGWIDLTYGKVETSPASLKDVKIGPDEIHLPRATRTAGKTPRTTTLSITRGTSWTASNRARIPWRAWKSATASANVCHLGNIAMLLHRKIRWDPKAEQIAGDDEAAAMLSRPLRAPWTI